MGSWSERCMITHCEIPYGEEMYVVGLTKGHNSLNDGSFVHWKISTTLLKGKYNDYGRMSIIDSAVNKRLFEISAGVSISDEFDRDTLEHYMYFRADALDMLRTLRVEFPWEGKNTIGEFEADVIRRLSESAESEMKVTEETNDDLKHAIRSYNEIKRRERIRSIIGYGFEDLAEIELNHPFIKTELYIQLALIGTIQGGMTELRMDVHPQIPTGPQHNGWDAIEDYANWLLKTVAAERKHCEKYE